MSEPNLVDKAKNLTGAVVNWATVDKFSKVSDADFHLRKQLCESCPNWDKNGYAGLGMCKLCGCSVAKLYIPSSVCPDKPPRWLNISASYKTNTSP